MTEFRFIRFGHRVAGCNRSCDLSCDLCNRLCDHDIIGHLICAIGHVICHVICAIGYVIMI